MLSVIIPALNAEAELAACLRALSAADELIVVDGGSTDRTATLADSFGARVLSTPASRGEQLRAGAEAAAGDWFLFVHADTVLAPDWATAAANHMHSRHDKAGYFRFSLQSDQWQARVLERAVEGRCRLLGLPYGDQGLLISRVLYTEVGGFAPIPLMEDVDLVRRIGRHRLAGVQASARTSAGRWASEGWAARSMRNIACQLMYRLGMPPRQLVRLYR